MLIRSDKIEAFMESQKQPGPWCPDDYGIVIESGEGEPSEEVKARMMREYGFNTDAMTDPRDVSWLVIVGVFVEGQASEAP